LPSQNVAEGIFLYKKLFNQPPKRENLRAIYKDSQTQFSTKKTLSILAESVFEISISYHLLETTSAPNGINASWASFKDCAANGMPMIVMARMTALAK
jgi:DNA-dependent RNA polymerase auxiliary subunit epsilon